MRTDPALRGDGTFCPDFDGVISTDDGAQVLFHIGGYGRAYPEGAGRQIVSWLTHVSDDPRYRWLNDAHFASGPERSVPTVSVLDVSWNWCGSHHLDKSHAGAVCALRWKPALR